MTTRIPQLRPLGERGASMVEYALLVMLIAIIAVVALTVAGQEVSESYSVVGEAFSN